MEKLKIEVKKEIGYEGNIFYCVYINNEYHSSHLDYTKALHEAEEIGQLFTNPIPAEILYSKEITR